MSDSQTHISSPSASNGSNEIHWGDAIRIPSLGALPYYSSRFEAAVAARLAGSRPKLPRKLKKRVKQAEQRARTLRDNVFKKLSALPSLLTPFVNDLANQEAIKDSLQSILESTPGVSDIDVNESADGSYSFTYALHTVTPVVTKVFTIKKPDGMSDDEFKKFTADLADEMNKSDPEDDVSL